MSRGTVVQTLSKPKEEDVPIRVYESDRDEIHDLKSVKDGHHTVPLTVRYLLRVYYRLKNEYELTFEEIDTTTVHEMKKEAKERLVEVAEGN